MSLTPQNKVTYVDGQTVITAANLNNIQDTVLDNAANKEDKVAGKGLSSNDFTTAEKTKLAGVEAGAQVNPGNATTSAAGLMSAADKAKLDGMQDGAQPNKTTMKFFNIVFADGDLSGEYTIHEGVQPSASGWETKSRKTVLIPDAGWQSVSLSGSYAVCCCDANGVKYGTNWTLKDSSETGVTSITVGVRGSNSGGGYIAISFTSATQRYAVLSTNSAPVAMLRAVSDVSESSATKIQFSASKLLGSYELTAFAAGHVSNTGSTGSSSTQAYCIGAKFPGGTIINTVGTALTCRIAGTTASGPVLITSEAFSAAGNVYQFDGDFFGTIEYTVGSWNWSESAPNISTLQCSYFVRVIWPGENPWRGKLWYSYGTSMTAIDPGDQATSIGGHRGKWPLAVDAFSGMQRINGAIGSGGIMPGEQHGGNVKNAILQTPYDCDLVTLELGPNDDYLNHLGTIDDTGDDTFLGNLYQCYDYLTKNTRAQIVFLAVAARSTLGSDDNYSVISYSSGYRTKYRAMVDAVKKLSERFGIPVIDADANALNLNRRIHGTVIADYIHQTYLGGEIYGRYIWSKLKELPPYPVFPQS